MLSSIILTIVGKIICVKLIFYFPYFRKPFGLPKGYFSATQRCWKAKRQIGSEKYALYARHIEEDFLKSIHDAQFGICHATGTLRKISEAAKTMDEMK
jgi:hypothetical protein